MVYKLWIDDDANKPGMEDWRSPPKDETNWKVARSTEEAKQIVLTYGIPLFLELDHDLGLDKCGNTDKSLEFLKWLEQNYPAAIDSIQGYDVHSKNDDGRKDIRSFFESWRKARLMP
jgi:hypothetical protein